MPTLQELRSQIAELEKQAADMHRRESEAAIATVKELVGMYGLTAEQIGLAPPAAARPAAAKRSPRTVAKKAGRPGAGVPKFADPATGKTWTGFGKPPAWIAGAKDREAFRIAPGAGAPANAKGAGVKRVRRRQSAAD